MTRTIKPPLPSLVLEQAKRLRSSMTDAERRLWQYLRAGRLGGFKFRRQHPVPPYIVDFCCVERRLVIELDGSQHNEVVDAERSRNLQSQGWRVVRYWNNEVLLQTEAVVMAILSIVDDLTLTPTPAPRPGPCGQRKGAESGCEPMVRKQPVPAPEGEGL